MGVWEFINSGVRKLKKITKQLADKIEQQQVSHEFDMLQYTLIKTEISKQKQNCYDDKLKEIHQRMTNELLRANELARIKCASSWLSALPLKSEHFSLNKREFYDAVRMRYRWDLKFLPTICACGKRFTVDHAMSCPKGGYIHQRHDEVRDILAKILEEISNDVETEPHLLLLLEKVLAAPVTVQMKQD